MLGALGTRNPFYLTLLIVVGLVVSSWLDRARGGEVSEPKFRGKDSAKRGRGMLFKAIIWLLVVVALVKGMSIHVGATILLSLPEEWPIIGGPITLEAMAFAGLDALSLLAVLAIFAAFTNGADYYALLRSVPPFMHQVGLITSIAITFVPQTVVRFAEIREAQALRGHRVRRVGDLVPLVVPLLAGGMERSMNLAEAMEARGFSRSPAGARRVAPIVAQSGLALGLGLVLSGGALLAFFAATPWIGWLCIASGVLLVSLTLRAVGAGIKRSRYRRSVWRSTDTLLAIVSLAILAILLIYKLFEPSALIYDPLARLRIYVPAFDPVIACTLVALAVPVFVGRVRGVTTET
jgi:energy-coupling factor transport system permease protein